ncbi:hypothetical protein ZWY2020_025498 [Hordeum vulgare]|nr:hypothetical protein ZWY2020_025498 [Hordeum vulgare]
MVKAKRNHCRGRARSGGSGGAARRCWFVAETELAMAVRPGRSATSARGGGGPYDDGWTGTAQQCRSMKEAETAAAAQGADDGWHHQFLRCNDDSRRGQAAYGEAWL